MQALLIIIENTVCMLSNVVGHKSMEKYLKSIWKTRKVLIWRHRTLVGGFCLTLGIYWAGEVKAKEHTLSVCSVVKALFWILSSICD